MSSQPFSDVRGNTAPSVYICVTCGLPLNKADHGLCQNRVELVSCEKHGDEERPTMVTAETEQAAACRAVAYDEFIKTTEGTPEYYQALEGFILLLFPDCNPRTAALPEAENPEVPPGHDV